MKKLLIFIALIVAVVTWSAQVPRKVILEWDPVPGVKTYKLYYGLSSRTYSWVSTNIYKNYGMIELPYSNTYYIAVTAVDSNYLESDYSSEVLFTGGGMKYVAPPKTNFVAIIDYKNEVFEVPITNGLYYAIGTDGYVMLVNYFTHDVMTNIASPGPPSLPGLEVIAR